MNKCIGLLLINKAHPEPLAKWNHDAILNEMRNFIKENNMQNTVTLKIGDKISVVGYSTRRITDFKKGKIVLVDNGTSFRMYLGEYYVNGKLYARENIIVPEFLEGEKMEHQPITKENIAEVLEYNKIDKRLYSVFSNTIILHVPMGENHYPHDLTIPFDMNCWLGVVDSIFGKLQPLPKTNPFDVVKVGQWIKNLGGCNEWRTKSKWYQRCHGSLVFGLAFRSDRYDVVFSNNPSEWDLTDIRDYNPNEYELKIGDEIKFANGVRSLITNFEHDSEYPVVTSLYFHSSTYLQRNALINGKKYDKITIPPFDFTKRLVDAGFKCVNQLTCKLLTTKNFSVQLYGGCFQLKDVEDTFDRTPANAKIIIDMAKLAKGLK